MEAADAVAWPFAVGGEVAERWEWLTDGIAPVTGMEQTRRLRQAPRIFLQFEGLESGRHRRTMETLLLMNGARQWHAPIAMDTAETTASADAAATSIDVDTTHRRFRAGGNAIIVDCENPARFQVLEIDTVGSSALSLAAPLDEAWPAGSTVIPTIGATIAESVNLNRFTGDATPYSITFRTRESLDEAPDFGDAEYRDLPVLELPVVWTTDPVFVPGRDLQEVDYGTAQVVIHDLAGVSRPRITVDIAAVTAAEVAALRALLYALAGRWRPIWVASYAMDAIVQAKPAAATIDVERCGLCDYALQANRRDLRFEMTDGTVFYRRITTATAVDADTERWVLDSNLPGGFAPANVALVSFMALCRQDADVNLLRLWSRGVVTTQLAFQGCIHGL